METIEQWTDSEPDIRNSAPTHAWTADSHHLFLYENVVTVAESEGCFARGLHYRFVLAAFPKRKGSVPECLVTHERFSTGPGTIGLFASESHYSLGFAGKFSTVETFFTKAHSVLIDRFNIVTVNAVPAAQLEALAKLHR